MSFLSRCTSCTSSPRFLSPPFRSQGHIGTQRLLPTARSPLHRSLVSMATRSYAVPPTPPPVSPMFITDLSSFLTLPLEHVHNVIGGPWWVSIVAIVVMTRTALLPITVRQYKNNATISMLTPTTMPLLKKLTLALSKDTTRSLSDRREERHDQNMVFLSQARAILQRHNCSPLLSLQVMFYHSFMYVPVIWAIRELVFNDPTMMTAGPSLFPDLTVTDPTGVFMLIGPLVTLIHLWFSTPGYITNKAKKIFLVMRSPLALISLFAAWWFPMGVYLYIFTSQVWSALWSVLIEKSRSTRIALGIPSGTLDKADKDFNTLQMQLQRTYNSATPPQPAPPSHPNAAPPPPQAPSMRADPGPPATGPQSSGGLSSAAGKVSAKPAGVLSKHKHPKLGSKNDALPRPLRLSKKNKK